MAQDWTENLTPDEAQCALDALKANKAPITAREGVELMKLKRLQAKLDGMLQNPHTIQTLDLIC
jgi:hypothetical protein